MKAISLWQPWASLWLSDRKVHETRHWQLAVPAGGLWLAVHAAKRFEKNIEADLREILDDEFGGHWAMDLPTGAIIGRVFITGCHPTQTIRDALSGDDLICGNFADGRFGWRRSGFEKLATPVPWKCLQGLFNVPTDLFSQVAA